jgi:hypothetical protein
LPACDLPAAKFLINNETQHDPSDCN